MMSYFWDNKVDKVFRVRFAKKDSKEEFMDYIYKFMVDQFWSLLFKSILYISFNVSNVSNLYVSFKFIFIGGNIY